MRGKVILAVILIALGISLTARYFGIPFLSDLWKLWPLIFVYWGGRILYNSYKWERERRKREKMREERYRILKMIEEGKISSEDGEELLKKLEENYDFKSSEKRLLRIYIEEEGVNRVNITIPLSFLKWGLKFANKYSVQYGGVDLSPEEIEKILNDPDFRGKIVDIQSDEDSTRVIVEII